jgi:hypothetical protein
LTLLGPVWAHRRTPIPIENAEVTKSVLYRNYIVPAAVDAMWEVLVKQVSVGYGRRREQKVWKDRQHP